MPANRSKRCSTRMSGTCRAPSTIGSTWNGASSSSSSATCDPGTRLRLRWPDRRHRSPDLPGLATHLSGPRPGAAARPVADDHRHRIRAIRSRHRPGREDRYATRRGGSQGARSPLLPGGDGSAAAAARRPRLPGRRAPARTQNRRRIELLAQMGDGPPQSLRNRRPFRCHRVSRRREADQAGSRSVPDGAPPARCIAARGDCLRRLEQRRTGRQGGGAVLRRRAQSAHCRPGSQRGRSASLVARRDAAPRGHQGGQPCEEAASAMKRWTNLALFVLLGLAFTTGWVAFFYGTAPSRASLIVHAARGYAIIALTPWKAVIAARCIQRRRPGWWASLVFTGMVIASIGAGILHSTGLLTGVGAIRAWTYDELLAVDDRIRATLDCTGSFYSTQDWSGVWLSRLLASFPSPARGGGESGGSSIHVRSLTGYDRRFAISDAGRLLIATRLGGMPLAPGNGFPVRLVAPDLRGYWWVKWVTTVTIDERPSWWQLPFPIQ